MVGQKSQAIASSMPASKGLLRRVVTSTRTWWILLVCAAAFASHFPVLHAEFLLFDDPEAVTENGQVLQGITMKSIYWAFTTNHFSNWMPITWISLMMDTQLYGSGPAGYHWTNLVLHVLSTAILLITLFRLSNETLPCVLTAAFFAVHPINVQAVAWIAERKGLLSSFFWLLGLLAYTYYVEKPSLRRYLMVSLCLVLSLMSKQMAVTFGASLLLLDAWPLRRLFAGGSGNRVLQRHVLAEKIPWIAIGAVFIVIGYIAQDRGGALGDTNQYPVSIRLRDATVGFMEYFRKAFFPIDLQFHYHNYGQGPSESSFYISLAAFIALVVLTIRFRKQCPVLFVGFWWFAFTLLPVSGLLQIGQQRMADRYVYMPMIGVYGCIAAGLFSKLSVSSVGRSICVFLAVSISILLGIKANSEAKYWHDDISLYERALSLDPRNPKALVNLGTVKNRQGDAENAKALYEAAILVDPKDYHAHHNLGRIYSARGQSDSAIHHYKLAIASAQNFPMASNNLGIEYLITKEYELAQALFEHNLEQSPDSDMANGNLATCHFRQKRFSTAEKYYRRAVELDPLNAGWRFQLARTLSLLERWAEAEAEYLATRSLSPRVGDAIAGCAIAQAHQGKVQPALQSMRELAALDGGSKDTLLQIAFIMLTSREQVPQAIETTHAILSTNKAGATLYWVRLVESLLKSEEGDFATASKLANEALLGASEAENIEIVHETRRVIESFNQRKLYKLGAVED
jgi:protein O-mannosyl-transferase